MSVKEYVTKFTQLSHYALHEVNTDEMKNECSLNGLNEWLAYALEARDFQNFQVVVNKALVLENRRGVMEHNSKLVRQHQSGSSFRPRVATSSARPIVHHTQPQFQPRPQAAGQGFSTPQHQLIQCPNNLQTHAAGNQSVQRTQAASDVLHAERSCFVCGEKGYFANHWPNLCTCANHTAITTLAPTHGANSVPVAAKQNYVHGKVNHVVVEEAEEAPDVVIGMFFVNDTSIVVLFDSGASHSFIFATYVEKHNLPLALLKCQMIVSSSGGDMPAWQLWPKVNLKIKGVDFVANLIVLESKGINIILGMD
jgi:hypothetical protein